MTAQVIPLDREREITVRAMVAVVQNRRVGKPDADAVAALINCGFDLPVIRKHLEAVKSRLGEA